MFTHSYDGLGKDYLKARKGTPGFARCIVNHVNRLVTSPVFLELGIGSGQQTEYLEKELSETSIRGYQIHAFDKSSDQLNVLQQRIRKREISEQVIPKQLDFDVQPLPLETGSIDISYMAHVYHHLSERSRLYWELNRVTGRGGFHFMLGVSLEDLEDHPLNEFFPTKFEYEKRRYLTERQLQELFLSAGFTFEDPVKVQETVDVPIDRDFLNSIETTSQDSTLALIESEDRTAFQKGVEKIRREVEKGEKAGNYRIYRYGGKLRVFQGEKL